MLVAWVSVKHEGFAEKAFIPSAAKKDSSKPERIWRAGVITGVKKRVSERKKTSKSDYSPWLIMYILYLGIRFYDYSDLRVLQIKIAETLYTYLCTIVILSTQFNGQSWDSATRSGPACIDHPGAGIYCTILSLTARLLIRKSGDIAFRPMSRQALDEEEGCTPVASHTPSISLSASNEVPDIK